MASIALKSKEKIVLLTITTLLIIAAAMYAGERFQPYKIAGNIGSYAAVQISTAATHTNTRAKTSTAVKDKYIVKKGDTVWNISKKFKVHPQTLKFANYLGDDKIKIGQELTIPKRS